MRKILMAVLLGAAAIPTGADATVSLWNGSGANDTISWGQLGTSFTNVSPGASVTSTNGLHATVSDDTGGQMQRRDEGNGWAGSFAPGTQLLWNQDNVGAIIVNFLTPVSAAGALIQSDYYGNFTATVTTNDGSSFNVNGAASGCDCGSNPFLGVLSDSANITSVRFTEADDYASNDFAIGPLQLMDGVSGVPEPATWGMMLIGFGAIGGAMRRRNRLARGRLAITA